MSTYWLSDFCSLFMSFDINPFSKEPKNERYNALTRLIILVTLISALIFHKHQNNILLAGLASVVISLVLYLLTSNSSVSFKKEPSEFTKLKDYFGEEYEITKNKTSGSKYDEATKKLIEQYDNVIENGTPIGKEIFVDDYINSRAGMGVNDDYQSKRESDLSRSKFFIKYKVPEFAVASQNMSNKPKTYNFNKTVQTGTLKQFNSLIKKDLNF
tara:strand:+ start:1985 stop:2626 length:642 start_codon:yes stop_codon:yes gene_type:complete